MLGLTLLVLLIASINYQLNLGYLLTFLLAGCAVVGMHVSHATLRGLQMHLQSPEPQFAGNAAHVDVLLHSKRKTFRYGIGVATMGSEQWGWTDVPPQGSSKVQVSFIPEQRGVHRLEPLTVQTRFPLGTFRVWTIWRPASTITVYPKPEQHPPPLPAGKPIAGTASAMQKQHSGEFDGVRAYQRGDARKLIVWKKFAKNEELVSRDAQQTQAHELWLELENTGIAGSSSPALQEKKLSRLCAWVLQADAMGLRYGLRLDSAEVPPAEGTQQMLACLEALAAA